LTIDAFLLERHLRTETTVGIDSELALSKGKKTNGLLCLP